MAGGHDLPNGGDAADVGAEDLKREALIYLPGLALGTERKTITGVVARIQQALDTEAETRLATWRVEWTDAAVLRESDADPSTPVATVFRKDADADRPVLDVFQFDWPKPLLESWENQSLFRRAGRVALAMLNVRKVFRAFLAAGNSVKGVGQLAIASLMLVAMLFYAGALALAAGQAVQQVYLSLQDDGRDQKAASTTERTIVTTTTPPSAQGTPTTVIPEATSPTTESVGGSDKPRVTWVQWVAILGSLLVAGFKKAGDQLRSAGASLFAAHSYLRVAEHQPEIMGGLRDLCEDLAESERYPTVRIVAYSFGSIVAVDALFPTAGMSAASFDSVTSLVTIGSPYDFVEAVRPRWSEGRHVRPGVPGSWLNIYSPVDLLGSNFRNDSSEGPATRGVGVAGAAVGILPSENVAWDLGIAMDFGNLVTLYGFSSHGMYWGEDQGDDVNVFSLVVRRLYARTPLLA